MIATPTSAMTFDGRLACLHGRWIRRLVNDAYVVSERDGAAAGLPTPVSATILTHPRAT